MRFADACTPVVTNVEAAPNAEGARVAELLERQVTAPVRFVEMIAAMTERGVDRVLEIGPGRVLTGLVRRIDRGVGRGNLSVASELEAERTKLQEIQRQARYAGVYVP